MPNSKFAVLVLAAIAAGAPPAWALQAPEPNPTSITPTSTASAAAAAGTTGLSSEADEAAALIAKANAAAAAGAAEAAAPVAPAAPRTEIQPSLAARKKATEYGFHAEIYDGKTMFCKQDAALGSRIKSLRCMAADEFEDYAVQLKIARDMMQSKTQCQGGKVMGGACGGIP